ncbi:MAG TPA: TonB-dependent receptor, partial [Lentimicrobium sp.]|nr:TonB-dependent receptor [Lentimicrobium sp.]
NDPVPELPALDATMIFSYKFRKPRLKPQLTVRAVAAQNHVSISYYEEKSPGYVITDLALNYYPHKLVSLSAGVSNLFDIAYYDHLNRRLLGSNEKLYEPGRSFYINLKIKI